MAFPIGAAETANIGLKGENVTHPYSLGPGFRVTQVHGNAIAEGRPDNFQLINGEWYGQFTWNCIGAGETMLSYTYIDTQTDLDYSSFITVRCIDPNGPGGGGGGGGGGGCFLSRMRWAYCPIEHYL